MNSSPPSGRRSVRHLLLATLLAVSLIISLTPLGHLFPASFVPTAHAASAFTSGNVVVYRVDGGSSTLGATATPVFLDEFNPNVSSPAAPVQSIAMPTATSGSNRKLTASGSAASEGLLTRSADGKYLLLTGYDATVNTAAVAGTSTSVVSRVVGRVDGNANIDTTTALTDAFSGGNPRSAASTNGTDIWVTGSTSGVRYTTLGATSSISVATTATATPTPTPLTNLRQVNIFNNQLYISTQSGTTARVGTVGNGTPTNTNQTITNLPGFPANTGGPYAFFFADLSAAVAGVDTLYVADDGVGSTTPGIQKYTLSGNTWIFSGNVTTTAMRGLTGVVNGSSVTLYATTANGASLVKVTDASGYNATPTGTLTTIASAGTNKAFRGVALAPAAQQVSTNPSGSGSANPNNPKPGDTTVLTVNVTAGTNPQSLSYTVKGDLSAIGGSPVQQFIDLGNGSFTFSATVSANTTIGLKTIPITITDDQSRTGTTQITINVQPVSLNHLVISQVYGGGGNTGATLKNDFIELYNPTASTVNLNGWTAQYGSSTGSTWQATDLTGTLAPGQYYLIKEAQGVGGTTDLPTPNATGTIAMGATAGKVALVDNSDLLSGACPSDPDIIDFVGYGSANCFEGTGPTAATSNTTAALRNSNGNPDTNDNSADFTVGSPNPRFSTGGGGGGGSEIAPFVSSTTPGNSATNVLIDSNITINFSEPVDVSGSWFTISCPSSGAHAATVTGGPTSFTLNSTADFANSEQCTVTVFANQVTDQDTNDPPDNMSANYVWSFTTVSSTGIVRDPNEHLVMGNPSSATENVTNENNYLMKKAEYALSYNRSRAIPNWTSWHLDSSWLGSQARTNAFRADTSLPDGWYQVNETSYSGSGFDRGHMCPSGDRTLNYQENADTFLMTNMVPQAPDNNQVTWEGLESYSRSLVSQGKELYIISGGYGQGGTGRNGFATTVDQGRVVVPAYTWKVILVLPNGDGDDVARVDTSTRTIAVIMPNAQGLDPDWHKYVVSVDEVEALTGYNFFSNVPENIQNVIEANADGNTRPVANSQSVSVQEDSSKSITLTATDAESDTLTYTVSGGPSHGTLNGIGTNLTYTPDANYNGTDSFQFTAKDKYLTSEAATVSITVTEVNDPVIVANDSKSTPEDTALTFPASDLTANDSAGPNESDQTLTVTGVITTPDTHGSVALNAGQITYTPAANYNGPASFDYQVCDNGTTNGSPDHQCGTGTVNITVDSVNDNPIAANDAATTDEDTPVIIDVVSNDTDVDGDLLTLDSVNSVANGTVTISSGKALFSPSANFSGTGSFTYVVKDGQGGQATGNVTVTINPVNDAPTADVKMVVTDEDTSVSITLTGSDVETSASNLSFNVTTTPQHGTLTGTAPNLKYVPNADYNGTDSFQFTVTDTGDGASHALTSTPATVTVTINPVNDAPVLAGVPANKTINELELYTFTATATDVDVPAQTLTFSLIGAPTGASIDSSGQFTWTPTEAQGGTGNPYQFKVRVTDGVAITETNVTINVAEVNQAPTLSPIGNKTVYLGDTLSFTAVGADLDVPAQTLSYSLVGTIPAGATINSVTGQFAWTPTAQQVGAIYTFKVRVTDSGGLLAEEQISVGVAYTWSDFLQPVNANGSSIFKLGRTIPVKFTLMGASAGINSAVVRLMVAKISDGIVGNEMGADSTSAATTGNLFRYDAASGQYIFNLDTKGLTPGTYQLRVDMGEGVVRVVNISLVN